MTVFIFTNLFTHVDIPCPISCSSVPMCHRWYLFLLGFSLHRGTTLMSRIAGVCLMDSWCFSSGCLWCCRYIQHVLLCFFFCNYIAIFKKNLDIRQVNCSWFLLLVDLLLFVPGVWNSKACGSDVSMGDVEDPASTYYDPSLQDLLPFRASSLPHHKHSEVHTITSISLYYYIQNELNEIVLHVNFQHAFLHSCALQAIWRTDLECLNFPAVFSPALWNSWGSNVWNVQPSLCY